MPDQFQIDAKIFMDNPVSQSDDFSPFYLRVHSCKIIRESIGGLAYNFEVSCDGVCGFLVKPEVIGCQPASVAINFFNRFINVGKEEGKLSFQTYTISFSICFKNRGLTARFETTST